MIRMGNYMLECPHCKCKTFYVVITRYENPLSNDDELFCSECGSVVEIPNWVEKEK